MDSLISRDGALPPNRNAGPILMWISGVLIVFVILTTALRLYVRARNNIAKLDDATMLVCVICTITRFAFQCKQSQHGNGRHKVYLSPYDYTMINKYGWFAQIFLFSSTAFLKTSIGLLILRIKNTKALKIVVYTVMGGVLLTNFGVVVILLAECKPVGFWRGKSAVCWPNKIRIYSIYTTIAYSVLTDLVLSLLPLVVVWNVKIPVQTKMSVCGLMGLGLVATGFGIARAASLGVQTTDLSWMYCIAAIWSNLELFLGIIAANCALSRAVFIYFFGKDKSPNNSQYMYASKTRPSQHSAAMNSKLRGDHFESSTVVGSNNRRPSLSRSSNSDIALVEGIQMKTEYWVANEDLEGQNRKDHARAVTKG